MLDTIVAFLWSSDMGGHTFVGDETEVEQAQSFIDLIYETADGFVSIAVMQDKSWHGLARAVEHPEWIDDERFNTPEVRELNKHERINLTPPAMAAHRTRDLLQLLEAHDVPCSPVLSRGDMIHHAQIEANGIVIESEHPQAGRLRQARQPARFSRTQLEHHRRGRR